MQKPNFIIIGAQKCGTTSLYNYIIEHPQILPASMKELHFFNWRSKPGRNGNKKTKWYLQQFPEIVDGENIITGEATPDYFVDPSTPQKMFELLPKVKLIVLLRNPVDRAISHYYHNRAISKKREPLSFREAIKKEPERLKMEKEKLFSDENYRSLFHRNYSYLERGVYIEQLEKWMSVFPREQFLILKSEDFYDNPDTALKEVFNFLGLPNHQVTNKKKYNQRSSSKSINPEIRSSLVEYFQPYNQRLEEFLGRKFNWENSGKNLKPNKEKQPQINSSQVKIRETPLLTKEAIQLLADLLDKKPDAKVLEFGSGGSTIWLSKRTKNLISIEHNSKWYKIVKNHIQADNSCNPVDLKLRSRQNYTIICEKFPDELFDLIIVDGRDRVKCVQASMRVLKPGGILMLNDAQRKRYKPAHNLLNDWHLTQTVSASRPGHTYWWQKPLNKMREKCTLSICAIMKNEGSYLKEWLEFHKLVGVERFYLYDNNSTDNTRDIIRPYVDTGAVILKHWPEKVRQQMTAYTDFLENYKHESEWVAFIDLDEFLFPTLGNDLKEVLKEFVDYPAVGVNWLIFGSSGHETKPEGLQMESYTYRGKNDFKANLNFKSIVRSDRTISCLGPHHFTYINNGVAVTENLEPLLGKISEKHSVSKLRINHYFTRSKEESKNKVQRGRATVQSKRKLSFVLLHDRNDVEDLTIQRFLPNLKKELDKINESYPPLKSNSESLNLSRSLIPSSLQSKKTVSTQGNLNKLIIKDQNLLLVGWVASINTGAVDSFKVVIGGKEITKFDLTLGLPSPGVKKAHPYLNNNHRAKFHLQLDLNQKQQTATDTLIALTPLFNNREGCLILAVKDPSVPIPSTEYIKNFGGIGSKEFIANGFKWLSYLIQRVDLKPTDHILDIGCGLGNIPYALTSYLKSPGRYEGFDIVRRPLKWLQQEISTSKPNFKFRFVNVYHPIYHPEGKVPLTEFVFPYPDESFDVVCLRDIFTHLQADEVRQYLREISRVLKPGGKCLFSCFLLNSESEDLIVKGKSSKKLVHEIKDCFTTNPKKPEVSIGYQESYLQKLIREQDLNAISKYYGSWCGRVSFTKPDLLVLQKNSTSDPLENLEMESIGESQFQLQQMKKSLNFYQKKLQKIQRQVTENNE